MTPKEKQLLTDAHARLTAGTFEELDVSSMLILLRNYVGNGPVRELALHVSHSVRDSGKFFHRILANKRALDRLGRKPGQIVSGDTFTIEDFEQSLNSALEEFALPTLRREAIELVLLCAVSILQGARVSDGKSSGELSLCLTADRLELCATVKFKHQGKEPSARFVVLSVPNRWLPICNPRASLEARGIIRVKVQDSQPLIEGFKPFEVYIEREPPIMEDELVAAISADVRLRRFDKRSVEFVPATGEALSMSWDGQRLTIPGLPKFFRQGSEYADAMALLGRRFGACVHDDSNAHWFLEPLEVLKMPPDGFHCHWVGRGSPTCTRPM